MLEWLQNWYSSQCDGDWEHEYGVSIETLDNPGWSVRIDLDGTGLSGVEVPWTKVEVSDDDWYHYWVENDVFGGDGDPNKLFKLIGIFKMLVENNHPKAGTDAK